MTDNEINEIKRKLEVLEKYNPKKFEQYRGRLDAVYEIELEKENKEKRKVCNS